MKQKKCKNCKGKGYVPVYFMGASRARGVEDCPVCKGTGKIETEPKEKHIEELEEKISVLLSCKNCPENKDGLICQKEYEIYDGGIKEMIDLNDLKRIALENAEKRQKNGANVTTDTRKMLKHCATEVVESAEAYSKYSEIKNLADDIKATDIEEKWESQEEPDACEEYYQKTKEHFSSELADIVCCCLIIAGKEDIDIERAIYDCIEKNERRANGIGDKL